LRAILLRHWKRKRTIVRNLIALGVKRRPAWKGIYSGRKSWWALSHSYPVDQGLRTRYFTDRGLLLLVDIHHRTHQVVVAPAQPQLVLWE
jgi:RNA-directed DNA polymerase